MSVSICFLDVVTDYCHLILSLIFLCFLFRSGKESSDSEAEDFEHAEKLRHVKAVLEEVKDQLINILLVK